MNKKNIAIIVQRYGENVQGGAETHCRLLAMQLSKQHNISVLTTTAKEYNTWAPFFAEGITMENNIRVHRFKNEQRGSKKQLRYIRHKITYRLWYHYLGKALGLHNWASRKFSMYNPSDADHLKWLQVQGPACPGLIDYIKNNKEHYDVFIFFSVLYYPTAIGIQLVKDKSILIPTVHDEKASYYPIYRTVMQSPKWILYNSAAEKKLSEKIYEVQNKNNAVTGIGIELPTVVTTTAILNQYNITGPYIIYIGRIEKGKGACELIDYFIEFKKKYPGTLQLVMAGKSYTTLKQVKDIIYTGFVSDADKLQLLAQSSAMIVPSKFESLSMVLLEAMYYKKPVMVNQQCEVLDQHITNSKGGFSFEGFSDFSKQLNLLLSDPILSAEKGANGYKYVKENYSWEKILIQFNIAIAEITGVC